MTEQETTDLAAPTGTEDQGADTGHDPAGEAMAPTADALLSVPPSTDAGSAEEPTADTASAAENPPDAMSAEESPPDAMSAEESPPDAASAEESTSDVMPADTAEAPGASGDEEVEPEAANDDSGAPAEPADSPWNRPGKWYVLHTQSGYENKVSENLKARTTSMNMEHRIYEVVIPMEDVVEYRQGKKVVVQKKMFPGYLLVRCRLDDDSWYVIRNTPGVTGFVGAGNKPSPLPRRDVETFLAVKSDDEDQAPKRQRPRFAFDLNETVRVKEGPFADFSGEIVEINEDQLKLKVLVDIFGRETPVELEFSQVAKL